MLKIGHAIFRFFEIMSCIGMLASLFVMIWIKVGFGIQILLSCFILFVVFTNLADKTGRMRDGEN